MVTPVAPACSLVIPVNEPAKARARGEIAEPTCCSSVIPVELPCVVVIWNVVDDGTAATKYVLFATTLENGVSN